MSHSPVLLPTMNFSQRVKAAADAERRKRQEAAAAKVKAELGEGQQRIMQTENKLSTVPQTYVPILPPSNGLEERKRKRSSKW
jgi:hypothetical protein